MDLQGLFHGFYDGIVLHISTLHWNDMTVWLAAAFTVAAIAISILHRTFRRMRLSDGIRIPELEQNSRLRFRKRDKVQFFARKVLRKGKHAATQLHRRASEAVPEYSRSGRRLRKRERMLILAKRMFQVKREPQALLKKEVPPSVLEADLMKEEKPSLPEEVMYLLQSVKVFGHFEKGIFLQLCRHMEILRIEKEKYLFRIGDADAYMYVIQDGQVNLYISEDGLEVKLSEFTAGESLHSLFSILDILTGHPSPYKTVYARAVKDSTVIRLPVEAFNIAFENRQDALVQMVQVVMTRMQRVTFLALHNYLGLSHELLKSVKISDSDNSSANKFIQSRSGSILSTSSQEEDLGCIEDVPDATVLGAKHHLPKELMKKVQSFPILPQEKTKRLRFGEMETVIDTDDKIFERQASLPPTGKTHDSILDDLKAIGKESLESSERFDGSSQRSRHPSYGLVAESHTISRLNEPEIFELVLQDMLHLFGIDDKEMLEEKMILLNVPQGYQMIQEGDHDVSLYFVVFGALRLHQTMNHPGLADGWQDVTLFNVIPGMLTGQLAVLTGEPSFFSVTAEKKSVIAKLSRKDFYDMMRHYPRMVLNTAHTVVQRASGFTRQIDFALDWTMVEAGKAVYKQDTLSDCMYIVLHGRLRSVHERPSGKKDLVSEFGRGEVVGMMEALRGNKRSASMHAVRDTELAKIPEGLLKHIRRRHPGVVSHLISLLSDKLIGSITGSQISSRSHLGELLTHKHQMAEETEIAYGDVSNHLANLSTVAILPVDRHVPIEKFTYEVEHALSAICDSVLHLNSDAVKKRLGQNALDSAHEYRLMGWLDQQEDLHRMVLYQTDDHMTAWTQRCIRQSDAILIVGNGDSAPKVGELERELESISVRSLKVLVLLHRPEITQPTRTVEWLNMRGWLTEHLHIKGSKRLFARTRKSKLHEYRERLTQREVDDFSDFSRLARFLTGRSVALVLGGGGARGIAQIGVIKSLLEAGVPIDSVGGTSIGAFVSGLYASSRDLGIVRSETASFSAEMSSITPKLFDLTYPITSMFSGASFNNGIRAVFGETQIEDLWIPYFTITTDITSSRMRVHTDGLVWKYVRASMSYTPYLPPMCDPKDGHYLIDGCYVNNVPGDVARSRGACRVIAVDVGAGTETDFTDYGDQLSGWWLLWKKWTGRWTGPIKVPDMNEIQSRLSYISCQYLLDLVVSSDYCTYLRPPITQYGTMDFGKWKEILDVGYEYGKNICTEDWAKKFWGELFQTGSDHRRRSDVTDDGSTVRRKVSLGNLKGNMSFTDLSEILKKKSVDDAQIMSELSDMEFEVGYESSPEMINALNIGMERFSEPDGPTSDLEGRSKAMFDTEDSDSSLDVSNGQILRRRFSSQNVIVADFE